MTTGLTHSELAAPAREGSHTLVVNFPKNGPLMDQGRETSSSIDLEGQSQEQRSVTCACRCLSAINYCFNHYREAFLVGGIATQTLYLLYTAGWDEGNPDWERTTAFIASVATGVLLTGAEAAYSATLSSARAEPRQPKRRAILTSTETGLGLAAITPMPPAWQAPVAAGYIGGKFLASKIAEACRGE